MLLSGEETTPPCLVPVRSKVGGPRVSSSLCRGLVELDFPPLLSNLVSTSLGSSFSNGPDAKSADLQIFSLTSLDPIRPEVVDRPVCHVLGRGRFEQVFGLTTCVRLAQKRQYVIDYEDQNPSEEVDPMGSSTVLLPADVLHTLIWSLVRLGTLAKLLELKGGESTLGQWFSKVRGSGGCCWG